MKITLAGLLFSLLAWGQGGNPFNGLTCVANAGVPPTVRAEGITELVGDIVLKCSGGTPTAPGHALPAANISVFLNTQITSRLLNSGNSMNDAPPLIDEPAPGSQKICLPPYTGCPLIGTGEARAPTVPMPRETYFSDSTPRAHPGSPPTPARP